MNDPPYLHFDPDLGSDASVLLDARTHVALYVVGGKDVSLLPSNTVTGDVDSTIAAEVNVSMLTGHPGDMLGINVSLAGELNITVSTGVDEHGLTTSFVLQGHAPFLDYKTVIN